MRSAVTKAIARLLCLSAVSSLLAVNALAAASSSNGTFEVGVTILVSCNVSGSTLSFGSTIDPLQTTGAIDASTTLAVTCTRTTPYTVSLSAGGNAGSQTAFGARAMKSGNNLLPYQLYLDAARSQIWGNGSNSSNYTGTGTGSAQTLTVYGRLPSVANAAPGDYTDAVTLTITY